jgi:hypothetical protein
VRGSTPLAAAAAATTAAAAAAAADAAAAAAVAAAAAAAADAEVDCTSEGLALPTTVGARLCLWSLGRKESPAGPLGQCQAWLMRCGGWGSGSHHIRSRLAPPVLHAAHAPWTCRQNVALGPGGWPYHPPPPLLFTNLSGQLAWRQHCRRGCCCCCRHLPTQHLYLVSSSFGLLFYFLFGPCGPLTLLQGGQTVTHRWPAALPAPSAGRCLRVQCGRAARLLSLPYMWRSALPRALQRASRSGRSVVLLAPGSGAHARAWAPALGGGVCSC